MRFKKDMTVQQSVLCSIILSLIVFIVLFFMFHDTISYSEKCTKYTNATITKVDSERQTRYRKRGRSTVVTVYRPHYTFNLNGRTYYGISLKSYSYINFKQGDIIQIKYDPDDPTKNCLSTDTDYVKPVIMLVAAFAVISSLFMILSAVIRQKKGYGTGFKTVIVNEKPPIFLNNYNPDDMLSRNHNQNYKNNYSSDDLYKSSEENRDDIYKNFN